MDKTHRVGNYMRQVYYDSNCTTTNSTTMFVHLEKGSPISMAIEEGVEITGKSSVEIELESYEDYDKTEALISASVGFMFASVCLLVLLGLIVPKSKSFSVGIVIFVIGFFILLCNVLGVTSLWYPLYDHRCREGQSLFLNNRDVEDIPNQSFLTN